MTTWRSMAVLVGLTSVEGFLCTQGAQSCALVLLPTQEPMPTMTAALGTARKAAASISRGLDADPVRHTATHCATLKQPAPARGVLDKC